MDAEVDAFMDELHANGIVVVDREADTVRLAEPKGFALREKLIPLLGEPTNTPDDVLGMVKLLFHRHLDRKDVLERLRGRR